MRGDGESVISAGRDRGASDERPRRFLFVLMPGFSLHCFASALDTIRIANRMSGRALYDWRLWSEGGYPVTCSAGATLHPDGELGQVHGGEVIVLCGGLGIREASTRPLITWLRREARRGVVVGGLCTAAHTMAQAGLLDGRQATIHWENQDSFAEGFPEVELVKSMFVLEDGRFTTAGGTASIDLVLRLIGEDHGETLAGLVADQMIYSSLRVGDDAQRLSIPTRIGVRHPKLSRVIQSMEANLEEPESPSVLARDVGLSTRQLERLFRRHLDRSPKRYYMELRLAKARNLLMQTDMSVINVGLACGFASPSHFSKCYRAQFGTTPYRERGAQVVRAAV